jgi:FkbM family methyltransferase
VTRRISYAQNGEDIVLHRALKDVPAVTYADVGAAHPVVDSVSKSLHELGWRGIHVEPVPSYAQGLREQRPDDVVVEGGAGLTETTLPFWFVPDSGLSTTSKDEADQARRRGWVVNESSIRVRPLADILDEHLDGRVLHALKVDVEGAEAEVLGGADLGRHRPWVVVVEATRPNSVEKTHHLWESHLTDLGYVRALFDGLNQWYVSPDHPELVGRLSYPACPLDPWTKVGRGFPDPPSGDAADVLSATALQLAGARMSQGAAEAVAAELRVELQKQQASAKQLAARVSELERVAAKHRAEREAMEQSTSWRLTRPVRKLGSVRRRKGPEAR